MLHGPSSTRIPAFAVVLLLSLALAGCASGVRARDQQPLVLPAHPPLVLRIDPRFRPLAPMAFPIEALTDVDRRVFVDSDGEGSIRRLVIVQFEKVQPGAGFRFTYPARPPAAFGAQTYRFGAYVHDDEAEAASAPAREAGRTRALLLAQGFKVPKVFRVARLARVADPAGMTEIILLYMEAADVEFPMRPLPMADEDGDMPLDDDAAGALLARLKSVITPVSG